MQTKQPIVIVDFSDEIIKGLTDFLVNGIGSKAYDGISYELLLGVSIEDKKKIAAYDELRTLLADEGHDADRVLAKYHVSNGFVYELNASIVKQLTITLTHIIGKETGDDQLAAADLVNSGPTKRRTADMIRLKNYIATNVKAEIKERMAAKKAANQPIEPSDKQCTITIALFSRNSVPVIMYTSESQKYTYQAYALRPKDLIPVAEHLIQAEGIRILNNIEICDILPSKTGVAVKIPVEVLN